jgi:hypothetical protein
MSEATGLRARVSPPGTVELNEPASNPMSSSTTACSFRSRFAIATPSLASTTMCVDAPARTPLDDTGSSDRVCVLD